MAGYYDEEEYKAPQRASAPEFDTMNMGAGPHRVAQFDTMNLGTGPHRVAQFDTMNLGAPVRVQEAPFSSKATAGEGRNAGYYINSEAAATPVGGYTSGGGQTPINPQSVAAGSSGRMHTGLVIASLCLRAATTVSLIIGLAVLASNSQTIPDGSTIDFSFFSSNKYALAAAIIGAVYSIYETVSIAVRLAMGHLLLPGDLSLYISYIGDQVVIVLLLSGASAAAGTFKDLHDLKSSGISYCDVLGDFCKQGAGAIAMIFLGFFFQGASLVISSFCFYKRKT